MTHPTSANIVIYHDFFVVDAEQYLYQNGLYEVFTDSGYNYEDARALCQADGGDLPMLKTQEDKDFLITIVDMTKDYWLGLNDLSSDGVYRWVDGTYLTSAGFIDWSTDPVNPCVLLKMGTGYQWITVPCDVMTYHICRYPAPTTTTTPTTTPPLTTTVEVTTVTTAPTTSVSTQAVTSVPTDKNEEDESSSNDSFKRNLPFSLMTTVLLVSVVVVVILDILVLLKQKKFSKIKPGNK
ncbi:CD209 antigen-like protein D [Ptychodera flava]|uniref:CD209 antigen-like protein D n=1 Tax=Ptychodera flava TaxID=63121 RepID=UPI003969C2ED